MVNRTRHAVYELYYHVVFIPKYREPRLTGATADRVEAGGDPRWDEKQGRLEIHHDEHRAVQPITETDLSPESEAVASNTAALDVGVNNLVACTTETGQQFLYSGTDSYEQVRETTMR